ncbi:Mannosyl-oligosaccharide alpha-1,2-mannosidase [Cladobotryum mycophilum]|uniref:alpha-1,2-Mannosidase n=1 Tax=Cladobotryum mycophilum TaxID=491253 RepID=A0ABR0S551_9HYPO
MLSQIQGLQGRVGRRYIVIVFLLVAAAAVFFWRGVDYLPKQQQQQQQQQPPLTFDGVKYVPSSYDWGKARIYHPVTDMKSPPQGTPKQFPKIQAKEKADHQDDIADSRKQAIKNAFIKSWEAYKKHAWGMDELMPLSGKGKQTFSGWSAQLVDALDTLWIMDLKDDFRLAVKEVAVIDWSKTSVRGTVNLFEVTIRYLGGLLAAYDLSEEPVLRAKAIELANTLYMCFDTPNRLPTHWLDFDKARKGETTPENSMSGAAGGTLSLEFTRLSQITGDPKYYDATERIKQFFYRFQNDTGVPGMWPQEMNYREETMIETRYTIAGGADSMYEYFPKMHALLGGLDPQYEEMTSKSLETIRDTLLFRPMTPKDDNILLSGNVVVIGAIKELTPEMNHLTCFAGGMYALAGKLLDRKDFLDLGSRLTAGCVWEYDAMPTNIMPEVSTFIACEKLDGPCPYNEELIRPGRHRAFPGFAGIRETNYLQRPEAIESVFYMWRITGDQAWRDAAWRMWEGIVRETETEIAFASISDVTTHSGHKSDTMETFWLAETVKYFYLIFEDESVINLDDWVFNTEAHPVKRPR